MFKSLSPRGFFLFGVLSGVMLQLPYIHWLLRTPSIIAESVPTSVYDKTTKRKFTISNVPAWFPFQNDNLRVTVASFEEVNVAARQVYSLSEDEELVGFYDPVEHEIWCVNSTEVLIHELRHVFEKAYHRNLKLLLNRKDFFR